MAKRFRDEPEASQVLTEGGSKRLKGDLPENEAGWEGLSATKLAAPLPGQHPYLATAPLRPANSAADQAADQQHQEQQWEQPSSPPHQQQREQQPSPQHSPQHWQQHPQQHAQQQRAGEAASAAAARVDWSDPHLVNAYLGWLHQERLHRHGQVQLQQLHLGPA